MAFPTSPSNDDLHTEFGRTFKYSSVSNSWSVATPDAPEDNALTTQGYVDTQSLPLTGVAAGSKAFVQDGNKLFIFTGSGWFEIATINTAPTITSGADATYTLNSDGTPTVITLQATDPEGTPIVWGYQVTSGSLEDTTVTNVDNVFTVTPGATEATFNLTFTASDGINIDTSTSSFTLAFAPDWTTSTLINELNSGIGAFQTAAMSDTGVYAIVGLVEESARIYNVITGAAVHSLGNPNAYGTTTNDRFGWSVAISGNYAIVGASQEDEPSPVNNAGKAYIFYTATGDWSDTILLHTLNNPNGHNNSNTDDDFGSAVAISGNYAVVSAQKDTHPSVGFLSGIAYIFDVTTGALLHTLFNPNAYGTRERDVFGCAVAISGNYAIVGAYKEDQQSYDDSGKAYIYNVTTGARIHTLSNPNAYGTPGDDWFGWSVAISGNYAIVGAYKEDSNPVNGFSTGRAYIFDVTTGTRLHTLNNPNPLQDSWFGYSVGISGEHAIVGSYGNSSGGANSGKAFIFDATSGALIKTLDNPNSYDTPTNDQFGYVVSMSGSYAISLAKGEKQAGTVNTGAVYVYQAS